MGDKTAIQLDLIESSPPLQRIILEAVDSPRRAYYEVSVRHIAGAGYIIQKASGASGAKPNIEIWFRGNIKQALEKSQQLINGKLNKKKAGTRLYTVRKG